MKLMRSRGHETALFAMADPRGERAGYDQHSVPLRDFKVNGLLARARLAASAIYSTEARRRIRRLIAEFRPQIAHIRNIYHHLTPSILWELKAQGVPVLYHINDFKLICPAYNLVSASGAVCERCHGGHFWNVASEGCYPGGVAASAVLAAEAYFHKWAGSYRKCVDLFLTPSVFAKTKLIENGWRADKIEVLSHFEKATAEPPAHPGASAPILYFGRLSKEKGVDDLVSAMGKFPSLRLVIAGDGPHREELERQAQSLGLGNILFTGHRSPGELAGLISQCQFTVFPSRAYETFGKSILESFSGGRAVVASDLGSRRELVRDGENGLLYEPGNVQELAAKIRFLADNPSISQEMGRKGYGIVSRTYAPESHLVALENIYARLIQARHTSPAALRIAYIGGRGVAGKYSGIETYYEETGKRLAQMGHSVTAYCRSYFTPQIREYSGIRTLRLPTIRSKHLETLVHSLLSTIHACFGKYDIIHYQTLGPALFSVFPRLLGKKTVVTVQGLDWQRKKWGWLARQVLKAGEWSSARSPNQTVVVSHALADYYKSQYQTPVAFIPNGTRIRNRTRGKYLEAFGLRTGEYILYLGRFSPEKNCDLLVRAFERLSTTFSLVLAGGSSHTDAYASELRTHQSQRIKILDWISGDALEEVLTNSALFVLPSDLEGSSLALLDAMGAGLCVLASDVPENSEVIGDAGFTFRKGDQKDLERMLLMLLADERVRQTVGKAAQHRVRERYLWSTITEEMDNVYMDLMRKPRRSALPPGIAKRSKAA
jgi:glycosyltransferase involved in cell wall biosynthesis